MTIDPLPTLGAAGGDRFNPPPARAPGETDRFWSSPSFEIVIGKISHHPGVVGIPFTHALRQNRQRSAIERLNLYILRAGAQRLGARYVSTGTDLAFLQAACTAKAKQVRDMS